MSRAPSLGAEGERRLNDLLAEYLDALAAGRAPDRTALLARHPDLAPELSQFFANHDQLALLAGTPTRATADAAVPEAPPPPPPDRRLGDYQILHEIARGGMGVVYRVRQVSLSREVALKMILPGQAASPQTLRRFRVEAEAAAHLDHPNIVPIYEVGELDGQPYFTMKLVEGGSLAQRLAESPAPPLPGLVRMMAQVARAVHHAHQRGVLHRDLKPANILLQAPAAPDRGFEPLVTDFGLAKRVEQDVGLTQSQTVVGTAYYMPPEQAQARNDTLTTAADVWALGAILYECLTGRPPFVGASYFDTLLKVVEEPVLPPRRRNPRVHPDLEAVCLRCLEKDPAKRYDSALELAEDLERWLAGDAVSVRRQTTAERARRWARRNPLAATLLAAVGVLMAVVTAGSLLAAWHVAAARDRADANAREAQDNAHKAALLADQERDARGRAEAAREDAEKARAENHRLLVSGYVANGTRALDVGDPFGSLVWYGEALRLDRGDPAREEAHRTRLAAVLRRCPRLVQAWFDNSAVAPSISPDGRRVLLVRRKVARAWDVASGEALSLPMEHADVVERAAFSPDGSRVVTTSADGTARVWEAATGKPVTAALPHDKVKWAAFSPDGGRLATAGADRFARVWDAATGKPLAGPLAHDLPVLFAAFSRDGKRLVTCGGVPDPRKGEIQVWDLDASKPSSQALARGVVIRWAHLTADGKHVVAAGGRQMAHLWPLTAARPPDTPSASGVRLDPDGAVGPDPTRVLRLDGPSAQVYDLSQGKPVGPPLLYRAEMVLAAFSPDGRLVVTAARDRTARVWDAATGQPLTPPLRHDREIHRAAISADGRRLLTAAENGVARVWDLAPREPAQPLPALTGGGPAALSPDGRQVAVVDRAGAVWVRDAVSDKALRGPWQLPRAVTGLAFSPDGRRVLAAADSAARVWDATDGEGVTPLLSHSGSVRRLFFTSDGSRAVIVGSGNGLDVYDVTTGAAQSSHALAVEMPAYGLVLTPDGRAAVVAAPRTPEAVEVRDVVSGALRAGPFRHTGRVVAAAFSPDGKRLAVGTSDGSAFLWDVAAARTAATLQHGQPLRLLAFSGDGRRLVTVSEDHSARVWDVSTGQPVTPLLPLAEAAEGVSLAPDGSRLVARARGGAGWVWDLSPDARPVDDLVRLTQLLSGQVVDGLSGELEPMETTRLCDAWRGLRASYPQEFSASPP
jgi:WD40 repeat protein